MRSARPAPWPPAAVASPARSEWPEYLPASSPAAPAALLTRAATPLLGSARPGSPHALKRHTEARLGEIEPDARKLMRGADGRQRYPDRRNRETIIGAADHVHGHQVRVARQRLAPEVAAPLGKMGPGGFVGASCAGA